jgi:D-arabinose 1-dehydrogenase-like Zn-dependent alcohol dehydrogenase
VLDLARNRNLDFPPVSERPLAQAQAALEELRAGRIVGRIVLTP